MKYSEKFIFQTEYDILSILLSLKKKHQGLGVHHLSKILKTNIKLIQKIMSILLGKELVAISPKYLVDWIVENNIKKNEIDVNEATIFAITKKGEEIFHDNRNLFESHISYSSFQNENLIIAYYYDVLMKIEDEKIKQSADIANYFIPLIYSINEEISKLEKVDSNINQKPHSTDLEIKKMLAEVRSVLKPEKSIRKRKNINKKICFIDTPENTTWQNITITFIDTQDVILKIEGKEGIHTNYKNLGFENEKSKLPNRQWELFCQLSKNQGRMSWKNTDITKELMDNLKHRKKALADTLKACFFQIDDEPFYSYRKEKAYQIKINLVPEPDSSNKQTIQENVDIVDPEIEDFYKEQIGQ